LIARAPSKDSPGDPRAAHPARAWTKALAVVPTLKVGRSESRGGHPKAAAKLSHFGSTHLQNFASQVRQEMLGRDSPHAKSYIRTLVSRVDVSRDSASIKGSRLALATAAARWKPNTPGISVPSFVSEWRGD